MTVPSVVGRDVELAAAGEFFDAGPAPSAALLFEGEPGIGKTTLWRAALGVAEERGYRVLASRPAESEATISFAGLGDLLDGIDLRAVERMPVPQQRALERALLLAEHDATMPDQHAVARAFLNCLRGLADERPLAVAVDDLQWLDRPSQVVLTFGMRRLADAPVRFLLAHRLEPEPRRSPVLSAGDMGDRVTRVRVSSLDVGAIAALVRREVGPIARPALLRIHDTAAGNPFFALELARALARESGTRAPAGPLPVPSTLTGLLRARIRTLPESTRRALIVLAAAPRPTTTLVSDALGDTAWEELRPALDAHVIELRGEHIRFEHPLLASVVYADADPAELRRAHSKLAAASLDVEERARHLALTTSHPDAEVAQELEAAAEATHARGARVVSAELFEESARLTPHNDTDQRARRLVAAAHARFEAGDTQPALESLDGLVHELPEGPVRVEARWRLGTILDEIGRADDAMRLWQEALDQTDDPAAAADVCRSMANTCLYTRTVAEATELADSGLAFAEASADPARLAWGYGVRAFVGAVSGDPGHRSLLERALELEHGSQLPSSVWSPSAVAAECARIRFDLEEAADRFRSVLARAQEHGNAEIELWAAYGLASVELLQGRPRIAETLADIVLDLAETTGVMRLPAARLRAQVDAHLGRTEDARRALHAVVTEAEATGEPLHAWNAHTALALTALSEADAVAASDELRVAQQLGRSLGVAHPALVRALVDQVEAAAAAGDSTQMHEAATAAHEIHAGATWAHPLLLRVEGILAAEAGDLDSAEEKLQQSIEQHNPSLLPLERARTLLLLGTIRRRARRRSLARKALEEAAARFADIEAPVWEARARSELARIGGRATQAGLTTTEQRIASLAADGRTNREIAAELFITVNTVEAALTRIYRKLDVRSRTELARRLAT